MNFSAIIIALAQAVGALAGDVQKIAVDIGSLQEALKDRCAKVECVEQNKLSPDHVGANLAMKAAELREERIRLLVAEMSVLPADVAMDRVAAAEVRMDAFCLAPTSRDQLDRALELLRQAEQEDLDPQTLLARRLHAAYSRFATLSPLVPASRSRLEIDPSDKPDPRPKRSAGEPSPPSPAPSPSPSPSPPPPREARHGRQEGYLTVRIEGGVGELFVRSTNTRNPGQGTPSGHLNASVHGRFPFKRVAILMGPYFAWLRAGNDDYALAWDMGGRLELEIYTSVKAKTKRRFSIHPFAELGVGIVRPNPANDNSLWLREVGGISAAPGLALCFLRAIICPTFRIKMIPDVDAHVAVVPQVGLGISLGNYR